jgi:hypothetical protein
VQSLPDRPRFRNDLVAQPIEEEGVRYVDVTDPLSGSTFRFYDVEYSIACAMDGDRDLDGLAEWTRTELGIETSPDELANVVNTLTELGYLEAVHQAAQPTHTAPARTPSIHDEVTAQVSRIEVGHEDETIVGGAPRGLAAKPEPPLADDVSRAYDDVMELGAPGKSGVPGGKDLGLAPAPVELGPPGASEVPETSPLDTDLMTDLSMELGPPGGTQPVTPAPAKKPAIPAAETSFEGLLDEASQVTQSPLAKAAEAARPAEPKAAHRPITSLDDDEPTQIPAPVEDEDEDDVSVDLSAHISLDKNEVQEAVRQSKAYSIPDLPKDIDDDVEGLASAMLSGKPISSPPSDFARSEKTKPPSLPAMPNLEPSALRGADLKPSPPAIVTLPDRPPAATAKPAVPPVATARPLEPKVSATTKPVDKKGGSRAVWLVLLLVLAAGGVAVFMFKDEIFGPGDDYGKPGGKPATTASGTLPTSTPKSTPATTVASKPATTPASTPGTVAVPAEMPSAVVRAETAVSAGGQIVSTVAGTVEWVSPERTVKAGDIILKIQGFTGKSEEIYKNNKQRLEHYQRELANAEKAQNQTAIDEKKLKVAEKQALWDKSVADAAPFIVTAASAGTVKMEALTGKTIAAGDVVGSLSADGAAAPEPVLRATFSAGKAGAGYKPGPCRVAMKAARDKELSCVVENVTADGQVTVKLVAGAGAAGDELVLLPAK